MSVEELRKKDPNNWVVKRTDLVDARADKRDKSVGVLVTGYNGQLLFLESCLKSVRDLGWTILMYDNPGQNYAANLPQERHYKLVDQFCMKHVTKEMAGPTYPQFWQYRHGIDLLMSTNAKYIFTIGGDSILEHPEGFSELLKLLGDGDIIACSTRNKLRHSGVFCGTKSFVAKKESFYKLVNYLQTTYVPFKDIGNMETRFGMAIRDLKLKEVVVPKLPFDDQFAHAYNTKGECTDRGTWGEVLGYRHLAGEHKIRKLQRLIPVEEKYFDKLYLSKQERDILTRYWATKDMKILENWWVAIKKEVTNVSTF